MKGDDLLPAPRRTNLCLHLGDSNRRQCRQCCHSCLEVWLPHHYYFWALLKSESAFINIGQVVTSNVVAVKLSKIWQACKQSGQDTRMFHVHGASLQKSLRLIQMLFPGRFAG